MSFSEDERQFDRELSTSLINQTMQLMGMILINKNTSKSSVNDFYKHFSDNFQVVCKLPSFYICLATTCVYR